MLAWLRARRQPLFDVVAVVAAALDVALVVPEQAHLYSVIVCGIACLALTARRHFPALVLLVTIPGFLIGWSEIAGMIALGTVAYRYRRGWQTIAGGLGVWCCRFLIWPPAEFLSESWREHTLMAIYAAVVAGMPVAIGLFAAARKDLAARIAELDASRARERRLLERAVRADERTKIAREMHDVVSHQVTLIAMQASALQVATCGSDARDSATCEEDGSTEAPEIAGTIRLLCRRTLEELRSLVGVLRTQPADEQVPSVAEETHGDPTEEARQAASSHRDMHALAEIARADGVHLTVQPELLEEDLPSAVSAAAYRTVQEALTNARKYAPGASVAVSVSTAAGELRVEIVNGEGIETALPPLPSGGHGLIGLRERAALLGGSLRAEPTLTGGFRVRAEFPLPRR